MSEWKVGILGLGHWYSAYPLARTLIEYPKADLVAVAWRNEGQVNQFASTFELDACIDYDDLIQRDDIDIVQITPPPSEIPECTVKAARAGKHIILGKPMAMTVEQADRMVEVVEESGVKCFAYQGTCRLDLADLKQDLEEGIIGDVVVMHETRRWSIAEDWIGSGNPGWFVDPAEVPGGAFIDECIYAVEELRWLAGSEVIEVGARMANLVHKDIDVEDWAMVSFEFVNGIFATIEGSWTINSPRETKPSPKQNGIIRLELVGTRGEVVYNRLRVPSQGILAKGAESWMFERRQAQRHVPPQPRVLDYLITCIEEDKEPVATIRQARNSFVTAMAAYESARKGERVNLSWE